MKPQFCYNWVRKRASKGMHKAKEGQRFMKLNPMKATENKSQR